LAKKPLVEMNKIKQIGDALQKPAIHNVIDPVKKIKKIKA
jgi:hypothetical protein